MKTDDADLMRKTAAGVEQSHRLFGSAACDSVEDYVSSMVTLAGCDAPSLRAMIRVGEVWHWRDGDRHCFNSRPK